MFARISHEAFKIGAEVRCVKTRALGELEYIVVGEGNLITATALTTDALDIVPNVGRPGAKKRQAKDLWYSRWVGSRYLLSVVGWKVFCNPKTEKVSVYNGSKWEPISAKLKEPRIYAMSVCDVPTLVIITTYGNNTILALYTEGTVKYIILIDISVIGENAVSVQCFPNVLVLKTLYSYRSARIGVNIHNILSVDDREIDGEHVVIKVDGAWGLIANKKFEASSKFLRPVSLDGFDCLPGFNHYIRRAYDEYVADQMRASIEDNVSRDIAGEIINLLCRDLRGTYW